MEWQYLRQGKGQNVKSFTEEFRKQALNLGISLDSPKVVTRYIRSLHSYIKHSLLMFEPTTIDSTNVKAIHLQNEGTHEQDDHPKRTAVANKRGAKPSCTHCEKEWHDEENCWKLHPKLRLQRNDKKGKQKVITTVQQNQDSKSEGDKKVTAIGLG